MVQMFFHQLYIQRSCDAVKWPVLPGTVPTEVYAVQLQPMYDYEFFGEANPLRLEEVRRVRGPWIRGPVSATKQEGLAQ